MTTETITGWQKRIHEWAKDKGWYECKTCGGSGGANDAAIAQDYCGECAGTGTQNRNIPEMIALIHSELSEALEFYRKKNEGFPLNEIFMDGYRHESGRWIDVMDRKAGCLKPDGFAIELADAVIRIMDLAEYLGIDLQTAMATKMRFNDMRPRRHGGKIA